MSEKIPYTDEDFDLLLELYMTDDRIYAHQNPPEKGPGYDRRDSAKNDFRRDLKKHLKGDETLGAFTIIPGGAYKDHCKNCTFDFDLSAEQKSILKDLSDDEREEAKKKAMEELENVVRAFVMRFHEIGLDIKNAIVSHSGNKGYHVDLFFEEPIPARTVYRFGQLVKKYFKFPDLEFFPKQPTAGDGYGNLVKIPLGIHKHTGKRCYIIDLFNFNELGSQFDALREVQKINEKKVLESIEKITEHVQETEPEYISNIYMDDPEDVKDITQPPYNAVMADMLNKCSAVKRLLAKAREDSHLTHEERLCLMTLFMYFGQQGEDKLHEVMSECSDYDYNETQKMLVHGRDHKKYRPFTCGKMQECHICPKSCEEIIRRDGRSPIKMAYKPAKVDIKFELIEDVEKQNCVGKTVLVPFKSAAIIGSSYLIPKKVTMVCNEHCPNFDYEKGKCKHKAKTQGGSPKPIIHEIKSDDEVILEMIGSSKNSVMTTLIRHSPMYCSKPNFLNMNITDYHHVQQILMESADEVKRSKFFDMKSNPEDKMYTGYFVGDNVRTAGEYNGIAKIVPDPRSQRTTFLVTRVERLIGNLEDFEPTEEQKRQLQAFKDMSKEEMVQSLAKHICCVSGRDKEVLAALLTIGSTLQLRFNGQLLRRGWMEVCFMGDSSQGKSQIPEELLKHGGICNVVHGGNATEVGLVGGIAYHDKNVGYINWGIMPERDKQLVFVDEIEKLNIRGCMGKLREVRSTGMAIITKVIRGRRNARVRMICSCNPREGKSVTSYKRGCQAIQDVMEGPDARRFDLFMIFGPNEVDTDKIFQMREAIPPNSAILDKETFRTWITWAWTRSVDDVIFTPEVTKAIFKAAKQLMDKYRGASYSIPLITLDIYEKLARITAASAVLQMRTTDFIKVIPTIEDVELAFLLIDSTYGSTLFGLEDEAHECLHRNEINDEWLDQFWSKAVAKRITNKTKLQEALRHINTVDKIRSEDLAFFLNIQRREAGVILQFMAVEHLISAENSGNYTPSPKLHKLIRRMEEVEDAPSDDDDDGGGFGL